MSRSILTGLYEVILFSILTGSLDFVVDAQSVAEGFPTQDCGTTHGCIGFPEDSCLANGRCTILLKFAFDPALKDRVPVEIYGTPPAFRPQNFWIAVGFNTEPQKMASNKTIQFLHSFD
jgi:hypothetical protein